MAERLQLDSQKLQQFIADRPWDEPQVWEAIRPEVVPVMEPLAGWLIDETGWQKLDTLDPDRGRIPPPGQRAGRG